MRAWTAPRCACPPLPPRGRAGIHFRRALPACWRLGAGSPRQRTPRGRVLAAWFPGATLWVCPRGLTSCLSRVFCAHRRSKARGAHFSCERSRALGSRHAHPQLRCRLGSLGLGPGEGLDCSPLRVRAVSAAWACWNPFSARAAGMLAPPGGPSRSDLDAAAGLHGQEVKAAGLGPTARNLR